MARAQRIEYEGAVYHVTARGNERRDAGPREVAARMLCDHGDLTQRQVAKILGLRSGSGVSKQLQGLARRLERDPNLRSVVETIREDLKERTRETKARFNA